MQAAFDSAAPKPVEHLNWFHEVFDMPLRQEEHDEQHHLSILRDDDSDISSKYLAGLKFFKLHNRISRYPFEIVRLAINDCDVLFMPAEMCVEYQLYAKRIARTKLTVAAYADCFLNYVATDEAFEQGGYEVLPAWTEIAPGCEGMIKRAIDEILSKSCLPGNRI
jgi:hypothetical protein